MANLDIDIRELGHLLARAAMVASLLVLPMLAVSGLQASDDASFQPRKLSGAGLVLLVSLQRAR